MNYLCCDHDVVDDVDVDDLDVVFDAENSGEINDVQNMRSLLQQHDWNSLEL